MKQYSIGISWKRLKKIPKKTLGVWLIFGLATLFCFIQLFLPVNRTLDNLEERKINVDKIDIWDSRDSKGSRMRLDIVSGNTTYYLWFPQNYVDYAEKVETELLNGKVTSVTAIVVSDQTLHDRISNRMRVVDLRSDTSIYYDLDTEKVNFQQDYIFLWFLFIFLFLIWLFGTLLIVLIYGVLTYKKKK